MQNNSNPTSHLIKGISRDLQKLLRSVSKIVTSMFKNGTGGCAGWSVSPGFPGCGGLFGVFPSIFVSYPKDLASEALSISSSSHQYIDFVSIIFPQTS